MGLLMRASLVHLWTQAGHVPDFAEFGCLRRVDSRLRLVARGTAQPRFQLASSMHNVEGSEGSQQGGSKGATGLVSVAAKYDETVKWKCFTEL